MSPVLIAAVTALVAGGPGLGDTRLAAYGPDPARGQAGALVQQALPPPPSVVVRKTERYGEVTIDHAAHLAVRAPCGTCHVTLPIGKITFTPQVAHRACIGCHKQRKEGPTQCAGCHVRSLPVPEALTAEAPPGAARSAEPGSGAAAAPGAAPPSGGGVAATTSPRAGASPAHPPRVAAAAPREGEEPDASGGRPPQRQLVELGLVAGGGFGPSIRVTSRRERLVVLYSFERVARSDDARLVGMIGAGLSKRVHERVGLVAVATAGFDAIESPAVAIVPALGLRAGVEWHPRGWAIGALQLGLTGVVDLGATSAFGHEVGGTSFLFATLAAGIPVRPRAPR